MLKRMVLKLVHSLATSLFTLLEVTGIPRIPGDKGQGGQG